MKYLEVQLELNLKLNTVCDPRFPVSLPLLTLFPLPERLSFSLFLPQSLSPILLSFKVQLECQLLHGNPPGALLRFLCLPCWLLLECSLHLL